MHRDKWFYIIWSEGGLLQTWAWAEDPELVWAHLEVIIGTEFEDRDNLYIEEFNTLAEAFEE